MQEQVAEHRENLRNTRKKYTICILYNQKKRTYSQPQSTIDDHKHNAHGFQCFTRHRRPQDEQICCSYCSCVFRSCMCTWWVLETSPSNHYWQRYEVRQWLIFGWFGGSDMWLARWKLGKKTHPNRGCHHCLMAAMVPSPGHCRMQQLANMLCNRCMLLKLEKFFTFSIHYSSYSKARHIVNLGCQCVCGLDKQAALRERHYQRSLIM